MKKLLVILLFLVPLTSHAALIDSITSYHKLDESSGNAADSVASYTLTNNNTVGYGAMLINNGADFGTANTNKTLTNTTLFTTGSFTYSFWFRNNTEVSGSLTNNAMFAVGDNTTVLRNINFRYAYDGGAYNLYADYHKNNTSDNNIIYSLGALGTSAWTHVAMTYDGTTFTMYLNGVSRGTPLTISGGGSGSVGAEGIELGKVSRYSIFGSVDMDEVGVWSRALSSTEITELYNSGSGLAYPFGTASAAPVFHPQFF